MKKEIVFAIILGLFVGGIITFGVYRAREAMKAVSIEIADSQSESPTPNPLSTNSNNSIFSVFEPEDNSLVNESELQVSGKSDPGSVIIILMSESEVVTKTDNNGNYSTTIKLAAGANILAIRSLNSNRETQEIIRTVVLSTVALEPTTSPKPTSNTNDN